MSVAAVHEVLDAGRSVDVVRADQMLERVAASVVAALASDGVDLSLNLGPLSLHVDDATPLSLVVNELLTNALKHAFPGGRRGTVAITLRRRGDGRIEATVADDGIGTALSLAELRAGTRMVAALAEQLGAEVAYCRCIGTRATVRFGPRPTA